MCVDRVLDARETGDRFRRLGRLACKLENGSHAMSAARPPFLNGDSCRQTITTNFVNYVGSRCEISLLEVTFWDLAKCDIDSFQREKRFASQLTIERSWEIGNWVVGSEQLG